MKTKKSCSAHAGRRYVRPAIPGRVLKSSEVSIAPHTEPVREEFVKQFIRIAKEKGSPDWPLRYLTGDVVMSEINAKGEKELRDFIDGKLKESMFGKAVDGTYCARARDGSWRPLQFAYRLVPGSSRPVPQPGWLKWRSKALQVYF